MMATEDPMKMPATTLAAAANGNLEDLEALLWENHQQPPPPQHHRGRAAAAADLDREREFNIFRSGSAPPTVEGSRAAIGSIFGDHDLFADVHRSNGRDSGVALSDEEMRSDLAYLSYYYSNENLNPRLPPPAISKEDWRAARRFQAGASSFAGIGDWRKERMDDRGDGGSRSLFSLQPGLPLLDVDGEMAELRKGTQRNLAEQLPGDWVGRGADGLIGLTGVGLGARRKSFADALQEEYGQSTYISGSGHHSRPVSRNALDSVVDPMGVSEAQLSRLTQLQNGLETVDSLHSGTNSPSLVRVPSLGSSVSRSFTSVLGSPLVRSKTPDPQLVGRSLSPCLPPLGGMGEIPSNGISLCMPEHSDIATALSGLNLSKNRLIDDENRVQGTSLKEFDYQPGCLYGMPNDHNNYLQQKSISKPEIDSVNFPSFTMPAYNGFSKKNGVIDIKESKLASNGQINLPNRSSPANVYLKATGLTTLEGSSGPCQNASLMNADFTGNNVNVFSVNQRLPTLMDNQLDTGGVEGQYLNRNGNQIGPGLQVPLMDPGYAQFLQRTNSAAQVAASLNDPSLGRNLLDSSHMDLSSYQKAYLQALLAQQKLQYGMPLLGKSANLNHGYYGSPAFGLGMPYPTSPISSSIFSSLDSGSPVRQSVRLSRFPSMMRSSAGGSMGSWNSGNGTMEEGFASSLLEEFKSNKTRSFELSDIVDHVVEFSADQYGSRFIQQKLETASVEDKDKIFPEIFPHARALMTDVFGNYVIQKFFEHGTEDQRKQLASQLTGHVLPLSLQMYGCRVIQKALEVVDVDQQTQMVLELDGSIMKCVRDQNGNHVIQKCIECVPQESIQFIISAFYGQVVPLSTHPYGCRVIQRVLEHCDDAKTQSIMMDEIMQSVCTLAQDQYGNYVVQHVLQHGKKEERSAIISKLAGQIVKMSQQKFASNVVEKCLTYGTPEERQLLINEMLGSTDENEPLQAMMKDQFGNYVVQKVLETCDDKNRELILSRVKVHLNALKRYTYGKHIVARVEKLVTAGERHIVMSSSYSS